jgi:uncharacterized protein YkwD
MIGPTWPAGQACKALRSSRTWALAGLATLIALSMAAPARAQSDNEQLRADIKLFNDLGYRYFDALWAQRKCRGPSFDHDKKNLEALADIVRRRATTSREKEIRTRRSRGQTDQQILEGVNADAANDRTELGFYVRFTAWTEELLDEVKHYSRDYCLPHQTAPGPPGPEAAGSKPNPPLPEPPTVPTAGPPAPILTIDPADARDLEEHIERSLGKIEGPTPEELRKQVEDALGTMATEEPPPDAAKRNKEDQSRRHRSDLEFSKLVDKSSPVLFYDCCHDHVESVRQLNDKLYDKVLTERATCDRAGFKRTLDNIIVIKEVLISKVQLYASDDMSAREAHGQSRQQAIDGVVTDAQNFQTLVGYYTEMSVLESRVASRLELDYAKIDLTYCPAGKSGSSSASQEPALDPASLPPAPRPPLNPTLPMDGVDIRDIREQASHALWASELDEARMQSIEAVEKSLGLGTRTATLTAPSTPAGATLPRVTMSYDGCKGPGLGVFVLQYLNTLRGDPAAYAKSLTGGPADDVASSIAALTKMPPAPALTCDPRLVAAANKHLTDLNQRGVISHTGADGSSPMTRIQEQGVHAMMTAENLSVGMTTGPDVIRQLAVDAGLPNKPHLRDLTNLHFQYVGIACGGEPVDLPDAKSGRPPTRPKSQELCVIDMSSEPMR